MEVRPTSLEGEACVVYCGRARSDHPAGARGILCGAHEGQEDCQSAWIVACSDGVAPQGGRGHDPGGCQGCCSQFETESERSCSPDQHSQEKKSGILFQAMINDYVAFEIKSIIAL